MPHVQLQTDFPKLHHIMSYRVIDWFELEITFHVFMQVYITHEKLICNEFVKYKYIIHIIWTLLKVKPV